MNAKKAKTLRHAAQLLTIGEPLVEYKPRESFAGNSLRPACMLPIVMTSTCTRAVYKKLKKVA